MRSILLGATFRCLGSDTKGGVTEMRYLFAVTLLSVLATFSGLVAQHQRKPQTISGEIVCLSCYLTHDAKGEKHLSCAVMCAKKGLPMAVLTKDGKLFVILEDHANASAYQQAKNFAGRQVKVTGVVVTKGGVYGIAVQKVESLPKSATKA